jgi:hypothetical protein
MDSTTLADDIHTNLQQHWKNSGVFYTFKERRRVVVVRVPLPNVDEVKVFLSERYPDQPIYVEAGEKPTYTRLDNSVETSRCCLH